MYVFMSEALMGEIIRGEDVKRSLAYQCLVALDRDNFADESDQKYGVVETPEGLSFVTDVLSPKLKPGSDPVFPHQDEARDLLYVAKDLDRKFNNVIDLASGGGHSLLPILDAGIAERGVGRDINPRAVQLARLNAQVNGLSAQASFGIGDVRYGMMTNIPEGRNLFVGNLPFALTVKGVKLDVMRDSKSANGLGLFLEYVKTALADAKPGDVIISLCYSRIGIDGKIEAEEEIRKLLPKGSSLEIELVDGATLWREYDGVKRQSNPMSLANLNLKAKPGDYATKAAYDEASRMHFDQGFDRLGYFSVVIKPVDPASETMKSTAAKVSAV